MKRLLIGLVLLLVIVIGAIVSLPFLIDADRFRPKLEAELTKVLGRDVKLGNLKLAIMSGSVTASDLSISEDPAFTQKASGQNAFVSAKSLNVVVALKTLIFDRKLDVMGIEIVAPAIDMIQTANGKWNFSSLGGDQQRAQEAQTRAADGGGSLPALSVQDIKITNGRVSLLQPGDAHPIVLENVNMEIRNFSPTAAVPFTITANLPGGGDTSINGTVGPFNTTDAARTPVETTLKLTGLDLLKSGLVKPSAPFRGVVSFDGSGSSDGKKAAFKGTVRGDKLILAQGGSPAGRPVAVNFIIDHDLDTMSGVIQRGNIAIGSAKAELTGRYEMKGDERIVQMKLVAPAMAIPELEQLLPALDVVLPKGTKLNGGTLSANLNFVGPTDRLVTDGTLSLNNTQLTGFDLGSRMTTVARLAGIQVSPNTDFKTVSSGVHADPAITKLSKIMVNVPAIGELTGDGTISAAHALDFKMRANVHSSGGALSVISSTGNLGVSFAIQGTSSDPKFIADTKGLAKDIAIDKLKNLQPADITKTVDQFKNLKSDDIGKTAAGAAGELIDLFGHKKK